jgi:hypothetical protein
MILLRGHTGGISTADLPTLKEMFFTSSFPSLDTIFVELGSASSLYQQLSLMVTLMVHLFPFGTITLPSSKNTDLLPPFKRSPTNFFFRTVCLLVPLLHVLIFKAKFSLYSVGFWRTLKSILIRGLILC